MIDAFYTPSKLAENMLEILPQNFVPNIIADFSAGEGKLLETASKKWPKSKIVANDLSKIIVRKLKTQFPNWQISSSNFLTHNSVVKTSFFKSKELVDLILLNPPFSQRGIKPIKWDNLSITSGIALAFIYKSLHYLKPNGYIVAILPNGALTSDRDSRARLYLFNNFTIKVIKKNNHNSFMNVKANTSIVLIKNTKSKAPPPNDYNQLNKDFNIVRGKIQVYKYNHSFNGVFPFIHSKEIKNGKICINPLRTISNDNYIKGPAVVFPRVGNITKQKIAILDTNLKIVMSDCLFALLCESKKEAHLIQKLIIKNWNDFISLYSGTGAQYITIERVKFFLNLLELDKEKLKLDHI